MKQYAILFFAVWLGGCASNSGPIEQIEGLSFTKFDGQTAAVLDDRGERNVIYGDMQTGEIRLFNFGQWDPKAPEFEQPVQLDPSFNNKLVLPTMSGKIYAIGLPPEPNSPEPDFDIRLILELNQNPCIPNAGCGGDFGRRLASFLRRGLDGTPLVKYRCTETGTLYSSERDCNDNCSSACEITPTISR